MIRDDRAPARHRIHSPSCRQKCGHVFRNTAVLERRHALHVAWCTGPTRTQTSAWTVRRSDMGISARSSPGWGGLRLILPREGRHGVSACRPAEFSVMIAVNASRCALHLAKRSRVWTESNLTAGGRTPVTLSGPGLFLDGRDARVFRAVARWLLFSARVRS